MHEYHRNQWWLKLSHRNILKPYIVLKKQDFDTVHFQSMKSLNRLKAILLLSKRRHIRAQV